LQTAHRDSTDFINGFSTAQKISFANGYVDRRLNKVAIQNLTDPTIGIRPFGSGKYRNKKTRAGDEKPSPAL
jgi:hypothetical protein